MKVVLRKQFLVFTVRGLVPRLPTRIIGYGGGGREARELEALERVARLDDDLFPQLAETQRQRELLD